MKHEPMMAPPTTAPEAITQTATMGHLAAEMSAAARSEHLDKLKKARERAKSIRLRLEKIPDPHAEVRRLNQAWIDVKEEKLAFLRTIDRRISEAKAAADAALDRAEPAINERAALARELDQAEEAVRRLETKRGA